MLVQIAAALRHFCGSYFDLLIAVPKLPKPGTLFSIDLYNQVGHQLGRRALEFDQHALPDQ